MPTKVIIQSILVAIFASSVARAYCSDIRELNDLDVKRIVSNLQSSAPKGWKYGKTIPNEIPYGHYWGGQFEGEKGYLIILRGPNKVVCSWKDSDGNWQEETPAQEILKLWIMPEKYRLTWKHYVKLHRPKSANEVYSGKIGRIYGLPSHQITEDEKFNEILKESSEIDWSTSPHHGGALSWKNWRTDLRRQFENLEKKVTSRTVPENGQDPPVDRQN